LLRTLIGTRIAALPFRVFWGTHRAALWDNHEPIREELFSVERLEEHARSLAVAQPIIPRPTEGHPLAGRLAENGVILLDAYRTLIQAIDQGRALTPAAEWLIDNYYLVERQIREIRNDLPQGYYRQLPKLADGPFQCYPRVFGIAWAFVAHTDSVFNAEMLRRFVRAYQEVQPLTIGELWAISITLRIVLMENLGRLARQIVANRTARQLADGLADRLLGEGDHKAEPLAQVVAPYEQAIISDAFAVQFVHRLRDQDPRIMPALVWLDERLAAQGMTADGVVRDVHRRQGASNVTVRNIITSLRLISDVDWQELFEQVSLVDDLLAADGSFGDMDFATRNLYRGAIEALARGSYRTEVDVATRAVQAARAGETITGALHEGREGDSGFYLLAGGRAAFERAIGFRPPLHQWPARLNRALGISGYASAVTIVAALLLALPLWALAELGLRGASVSLLGLLGVIPALDAAVALVNRAVSAGFGAALLPALELRDGVPPHLRTLVAVPTLLTTPEAIEAQIERLEIHHLASPSYS
jgi:cyclic beta-1,2-glucan synthetase